MAAKTWEEIKNKNVVKPKNTKPVKTKTQNRALAELAECWPNLCDAWGMYNDQYVHCREPRGHKNVHAGMAYPHIRISWPA